MPDETDRDLSLLRRVGRGDRAALGGLVADHQAAVYRYARTLVRSDEAAEDVLQETFVDAMGGAAGFRGEARVRTWLLTLARHAAYRSNRLRAGEPRHFEPLDALGAQAGWGEEDPETLVLRSQRREILERALRRLARDEQEILLLRDLEGLPGTEVSAMLGITTAAMKSRLHRARLRLTARLREEVADGP